MAPSSQTIAVQAFVTDQAFVDYTKYINDVLGTNNNVIGSLSQTGLSYFNTPSIFNDSRTASTRTVLWAATTSPRIIVDDTTFSNFVSTVNNLGTSITTGLFKIVDALAFNYNANTTSATIETFLTTDTDTSAIYVPGSFSIATTINSAKIYSVNSEPSVSVPAFVTFTIAIISGVTTENYEITLFTSNSAWMSGYGSSTIVNVIPPLSYEVIYTDSLTSTSDNVFTTASTTATLSYTDIKSSLTNINITGIAEYIATVVDTSGNQVKIPFNVLYKGQNPTQMEVIAAIKADVLASGVGTASGWQARIPGLFISGRFYIIPLWSETYTKTDQAIFPNIQPMTDYSTITNKILASLNFGDLTNYIDVLSVYYNRMTVVGLPDISGATNEAMLSTIIPDYQNYSSTEENFLYMEANTQTFASNVNAFIAADYTGSTTQYTPTTENLITFYSFIVGTYEMCVITKACYTTIMGSSS